MSDQTESSVGHLMQPDSDIEGADVTAEEVAHEVIDGDDPLSAEEAAMHITDDPPMADSDGYLDEG